MAEAMLASTPDLKQRLLALLLLGTALATGYVLLAEPLVLRYQQQRQEVANLRLAEVKLLELIGRRPELEARVAAMEAGEADTAYLFNAPTPELAAALLAAKVREVIEAVDGEIRSSRNRPPKTSLGLTRVEVTIGAELPYAALPAMLAKIESGKPAIFLDSVSLRSQQNSRSSGQDDRITMQVTARAYTELSR